MVGSILVYSYFPSLFRKFSACLFTFPFRHRQTSLRLRNRLVAAQHSRSAAIGLLLGADQVAQVEQASPGRFEQQPTCHPPNTGNIQWDDDGRSLAAEITAAQLTGAGTSGNNRV